MSKNISVNLSDELMNFLQVHPVLRFMNRSKLVREALEDFITKNFQSRREDSKNEKSKE